MGFSRKSNDSGPQQWRWTSHQTSCLGLRLLLRWQEGAQRNHGAPTLPALASSRPSAALCWVSPDASQRGPQNWIRTRWRGFQEDESVNTMELQGSPLSYCKSSKNHLKSKIIPSPLFSSFLSSVSPDLNAKSVSPFPFFSIIITTKHAHAFLFCFWYQSVSLLTTLCVCVCREEREVLFCFEIRF